MTGSPEVLKTLTAALVTAGEAFDALHNQEHLWEHEGFGSLEDWFDEANRDVWCIHHKLLKRVYKLGGWPEGVTDDPEEAFRNALKAFADLHDACKAVQDAADEADDSVTDDKLVKLLAKIESWIVAAEEQLKKIARLKPDAPATPFMAEQF